MVRSITSQPTSISRLRACDGEISWSTKMVSISRLSELRTIPSSSAGVSLAFWSPPVARRSPRAALLVWWGRGSVGG